MMLRTALSCRVLSLVSSLAILTVSTAVAEPAGTHTLTVMAETPAVRLSPQPAGRRFFNLPSLDYAFQLEARCDDGWEPESLSLSVADARTTLSRDRLHESPEQQVRLQVPAKQIAPVVLRSFCVIDGNEEGSGSALAAGESSLIGKPSKLKPSKLIYGAALSAQVSLRCSNGPEHETIYVSKPLDVELACEDPDATGTAG